jgi:hypothetical protein
MGGPSFDEVAKKHMEEEVTRKAGVLKSAKLALVSLRQDGITKVIVEYDGHNDDGFLTTAVMIAADGKRTELRGNELSDQMYQPTASGRTKLDTNPSSPLGAMADFVLHLLEDEHGGWETNEGAFGTCEIDVETGEYSLNHVHGYGKPYELRGT